MQLISRLQQTYQEKPGGIDAPEEQRQHFSYIFFTAKLIYTVIVFGVAIAGYLQVSGLNQALTVGLAAVGLVIALGCFWLVHRNRLTPANAIIFCVDIIIALSWAHLSGGTYGAVPIFLFSVYTAQAFLLPTRLYNTIALSGLLGYLLLSILEQTRLWPTTGASQPLIYILNYLLGFAALLVVGARFSGSLRKAVVALGSQRQSLDEANTNLLAQQHRRELVGSQVATAASQLAHQAAEQAVEAQQTKAAITESSIVVARLSEEARKIASSAEGVSQAAERTLTQLAGAQQSLQAGIGGVEQTAQQVNVIVVLARQLEQRSRSIGSIIESIEQIASESHLLALNATIEAAGHDSSSRRFGAVASEMQTLAHLTEQATVQVRSLLAELQRDINEVVAATQVGLVVASKGVAKIREVAVVAAAIEDLSRETTKLAQFISQTTAAQQQASEQAASQMQVVLHLADQKAGGAEESAVAAASLREAANRLLL